MPSWPMAMPSSTAMVLNSAAKHPRASIRCLTYWPISCRCTWPGTNWVNELAMPMIGRPNCSSRMPLARQRLLAPAIRRPVVVTALLSVCFIFRFRFQSVFRPVPETKRPFPGRRKALSYSSIMHATFLPLSSKDDEVQGNDDNDRMKHGLFFVFVRNKSMDIESLNQIIS